MTAAGVLAFAFGHLLGLEQIFFVVLTAIIVMQASLGGSLKATFDRFLGSVGGAVWGVAAALLVPHPDIVWHGVAFALAIAPPAVVAALRPAFRVAPVTAAIILLSPLASESALLESALDRVMEIGLGSVIALAVALLVLPSRAHALLAQAAARALALMADQVVLLFKSFVRPAAAGAVLAQHDEIRAALGRVETMADEALRERAHYLSDAPHPEPLARTLRRVRNDLVMIARTATGPLPETVAGRLAAPIAGVANALAAFLRASATALENGSPPPPRTAVSAARAAYEGALAELRHQNVLRGLPDEALPRLFGLAFALEQLDRNLDDLAARVAEMAR